MLLELLPAEHYVGDRCWWPSDSVAGLHRCWGHYVGDTIFRWWHQNLDSYYTIWDFGAQNKSAFKALIICNIKNCHQHFVSPTSIRLWLRYNLYRIRISDSRFDFFLSYRAMCRCCMNTYQLQLQYRLGILLRSGLEMYNMILHIHTCLDMLYLDHVHHMRPFIELFIGEPVKLTSVS